MEGYSDNTSSADPQSPKVAGDDDGDNNPHESSEDNPFSAVHAKACALMKMAESGKELSEEWIQSKIAAADENLTAIHDYLVHGKEATDSKEHGDDGGDGGDMGGGFIISIERALGK